MPTTSPAPPKLPVILWRGVARRCPRCGEGHLFRRWFDLLPACPRCGLPFEQGEGYWLGAMAINLGVAETVTGVVVLVGAVLTWPHTPWVWLTVAAVALNAVVPVAFYPFSKTIFLAIDLLLHRERLRWAPEDARDDWSDLTTGA